MNLLTPHLSDETLNEYLDQTLEPGLRTAIQAHLDACRECSSRLDEFSSLFAGLTELPDLALEIDFSPPVIAQIEARQPALPRQFRWLTILQAIGALISAILAWPLAENFTGPLPMPSISDTFTKLSSSWLMTISNLQVPSPTFELPALGLDLPSTTLTFIITAIFLLWLTANSLLLNPRSRRIP